MMQTDQDRPNLSDIISQNIMPGNELTRLKAELLSKGKLLAAQLVKIDKLSIYLKLANDSLSYKTLEKDKRISEFKDLNLSLDICRKETEDMKIELSKSTEQHNTLTHKNKRITSQLLRANADFEIQDKEKNKKARELMLANQELIHQNQEKSNQAAELVVANNELDFLNREKSTRAAELIVANKALLVQNQEKDRRALELTEANNSLERAQREKMILDNELTLANKTLRLQNLDKEKQSAELQKNNMELVLSEKKLTEYIKGLEDMMFMTSHKVRQPVTNIMGLTEELNPDTCTPDELKQSIYFLKASALSLDNFTKELTVLMAELSNRKNLQSKTMFPMKWNTKNDNNMAS